MPHPHASWAPECACGMQRAETQRMIQRVPVPARAPEREREPSVDTIVDTDITPYRLPSRTVRASVDIRDTLCGAVDSDVVVVSSRSGYGTHGRGGRETFSDVRRARGSETRDSRDERKGQASAAYICYTFTRPDTPLTDSGHRHSRAAAFLLATCAGDSWGWGDSRHVTHTTHRHG